MARPPRSRSRTRAQARNIAEQRAGYLKLAAAVVIIGAVAAVYYMVLRSNRTLDPVTLCPDSPSSVTVLLVDVTDPMNLPQRQDFRNQFVRLKTSIPRYGQLTVVRVDATASDLLRPIIVRCNPGTAADTNDWWGNRDRLQRQWSKGFDKPLSEAFDKIAVGSGATQSPIMESIQSVALTELQEQDTPRRLLVASDLLQNTDAMSFYRGLPEPAEFIASDAFRRVRTNLRGVDVELWQLQRSDSGTTQPRALSQLWEHVIEEQGGSVSRIYNVSG